MKFGLNRGYVILLSVLLFCVSCGDADLFDTDKWSSQVEGWEPGIRGAVAHGEFTLWNFLQDTARDAAIQKEFLAGDSVLVIKHTEKDIYQIHIEDVFELEGTDIRFDKSLALPEGLTGEVESLPLELRSIKDTIEADIPLPAEYAGTSLKQITLKEGTCTYLLPVLDDVKYSVSVSYKSEGRLETLLDATEAAGGKRIDLSLQDKVFDLEDNKIELFFDIELKEGEYRGASFDVSITFSGYDFSRIEGKVVKAEGINIDRDHFNIDIDFLNEIGGDFKFTDPRMELVLRNKGIGLPVAVDMIFAGQGKEEQRDSLKLTAPLTFEGNPDIAQTKPVSQTVDKDNSTIVDFLSLPPQGDVYYWGHVELNPDGEDNVIYKDGALDMDVNISVPIALTGNLSYCDTLTDIDIDQKYADKIVEGTISLNIQENGLPLDLSVPKLILLDEENHPLDTVAVATTGEGNKIKAGQGGVLKFNINQKQAKDLGRTKNILLEAVVSGTDGKPVSADAKLKFVLMLEAKADIRDYDDF